MTSSQPHYLLLTHSAILQEQLLQNDSDFPTCLSACECKHTCTHTGAHMCALRAFARPGQARDSPSATSVRRTTSPAPRHTPPCPHSPMDFSAGQQGRGISAGRLRPYTLGGAVRAQGHDGGVGLWGRRPG